MPFDYWLYIYNVTKIIQARRGWGDGCRECRYDVSELDEFRCKVKAHSTSMNSCESFSPSDEELANHGLPPMASVIGYRHVTF